MSSTDIPKISFKKLLDNDSSVNNQLSYALESHGFFEIIDHGISKDSLAKSYDLAAKFFNLSNEIKNRYSHPEFGGARGYTQYGKETALGETTPDQKEFWHHGPDIDASYDSRIHRNIVVNELSDFNDHFNEVFKSLNNLGMKILSSIARTLTLNENFFDDWVSKGNSILRLIHYPPIESENFLRARPHEDINLITLLVGAKEPGLELKSKDNEWIPIQSDHDGIICNIGDMMQLVTRNQLKSTTHRVIHYDDGTNTSRYSMPFFLHPAPNVMLRSIVNDCKDEVLAHDFLEERVKAIKLY
jgi:isopenicillin N synthase-like dioxygenase